MAQVLAQFLQFLAGGQHTLLEVVELGLLLGGEDLRRLGVARRFLQLLHFLSGLLQVILHGLDLAEVLFLRVGFHLAHHRERAEDRGASTQGRQVIAGGRLLHQALRKGEVAVGGHHHTLAEDVLDLHRRAVGEHVGVGHDHHRIVRRTLFQLRGFGRLLGVLAIILLRHAFGNALRKRRLELAGQARREGQALVGWYKTLHRRVARQRRHDAIDEHVVGRGLHQLAHLQARRRLDVERAGERQQHGLDLAGSHIVAVHRGAIEREDGRREPLAGARGVGDIRQRLAKLHVHAPGLEQARQRGLAGLALGHRHHRVGLLVEIHVRVDKGDQLAAAQDELIERVLGTVGNVARVDEQQGLDGRVDGLGGDRDVLHLEIALQLAGQHPRLGRLARHHVHRGTHHRHRAHQADDRTFGVGHAGHGTDQVVLEQAFALRIDARNGLLAVQARDRQAHIELLAGGERLRLDTVELRRVLFVGIRLGVVLLDDDVAAACRLEFAQQVVYALGETLQLHRHGVVALRDVQAHLHRAVELAEDFLGALGKREQLAVGEVGAHRHARGEEVAGHQKKEQGDQPDCGIQECG